MEDQKQEEVEEVAGARESDVATTRVSRAAVWALLGSHCLSAWGDRSWQLAAPMLLSDLYGGSLLQPSIFALASLTACVMFGSSAGRLIDTHARVHVLSGSIVAQNLCVAFASLVLWALFAATNDPDAVWSHATLDILFTCAVILASLAALASLTSDVAVQRDWVAVLAAGDQRELARLNAWMLRINLVTASLSPVAFSVVLDVGGATTSLAFVALWNVVSCFFEVALVVFVYGRVPELRAPRRRTDGDMKSKGKSDTDFDAAATGVEEWAGSDETLRTVAEASCVGRSLASFHQVLETHVRPYFRQEALLASLAFVFLFATVLSPDALLFSFLRARGVSAILVAVWRAVSAFAGIAATFATPRLVERFTENSVGVASLWLQFAVLVPCVVVGFVTGSDGVFVYVLMASVLVSRLFLWSFDLIERGIMQKRIAEHERGVVNAFESALTNVAWMLAYAGGIVFSDINQFSWLTLFSTLFVLLAALAFSRFAKHEQPSRVSKPNSERQFDSDSGSDNAEGHTLIDLGHSTRASRGEEG